VEVAGHGSAVPPPWLHVRRRRGRRQRPPRWRPEEMKRWLPRRPLRRAHRRAMELPHRLAQSSPTIDRGCFERRGRRRRRGAEEEVVAAGGGGGRQRRWPPASHRLGIWGMGRRLGLGVGAAGGWLLLFIRSDGPVGAAEPSCQSMGHVGLA
jgi:hypothetical protein